MKEDFILWTSIKTDEFKTYLDKETKLSCIQKKKYISILTDYISECITKYLISNEMENILKQNIITKIINIKKTI